MAAYLVKLHEQKRSMGALRTFLVEHPALVWLLGFKLVADPTAPHGFNGAKSVPQRRQLNRVLRDLSNDACQFLLDSSVQLIRDALPPELAASFGDVVAGDTKHLLAWVKENNPKQYIKEGRFDPKRQPKGDPDCTLGVKKRRNLSPEPDATPAPTPTTEAVTPSHKRGEAEYYWGYASGVVASIIPGWGEVVLAERTRPFNESDISYFFPLMQQTERRLGRKPRFGAWDTAFDAFYVYEYFHTAGGFAAVPVVHREKTPRRQFTPDGQPLCAAGLAMPRLFLYHDRTSSLVAHQREKCGCPLLHPTPTGRTVRVTTLISPRAAAPPHWRPASARACAGNSTVKATSTGRSLTSARSASVSTLRRSNWASSGPNCAIGVRLPTRTHCCMCC